MRLNLYIIPYEPVDSRIGPDGAEMARGLSAVDRPRSACVEPALVCDEVRGQVDHREFADPAPAAAARWAADGRARGPTPQALVDP
jgi:hypothetical protein